MTNGNVRCLVLGVTGGVASGKSTLASWFEAWGACRVSADEIARALLAPGSIVTQRVLSELGDAVAQAGEPNAIDRKNLAQLIYADDSARRALGEIMHPIIREHMRSEIDGLRSAGKCPLIVAEIPLLYENDLESMVDASLVAACSEATQLLRLKRRQQWLADDAALRQVRSQIPLAEKAKRADYVISTEDEMPVVEQRAHHLFKQLARPLALE